MSEILVSVDSNLTLSVETGEDYPEGGNHLCYVDILHEEESLARINSPSKPWENFTLKMVSNIIMKQVDAYNSQDNLEEKIQDAFQERERELKEVYG